jgi:hypothetical protein
VSIRPHRTSRLKLEGFSRNLILERFGGICRENPVFIKRGTLHEDLRNFMIISRSNFLRMRNVSEQKLWRTSGNKYDNDFPKIVRFMRQRNENIVQPDRSLMEMKHSSCALDT